MGKMQKIKYTKTVEWEGQNNVKGQHFVKGGRGLSDRQFSKKRKKQEYKIKNTL